VWDGSFGCCPADRDAKSSARSEDRRGEGDEDCLVEKFDGERSFCEGVKIAKSARATMSKIGPGKEGRVRKRIKMEWKWN
jgi:hypothetical protein